jgi:hypothetical protein
MITRRGPLKGTMSLLSCLHHLGSTLSTSLRTGSHSRTVLLRHADNFGSAFSNRLERRIYETKFPTQVSFVFFFPFVCRFTLTFTSTRKTSFLFMIVAILPCYQSPGKNRNTEVEGNFTLKVNYRYYGHFAGLEFM